MSTRALSPVVAVALLGVVTVLAAAAVGAVAVDAAALDSAGSPKVALGLDVDAATDRIALTHRGGDALDVATLRVRVTVDGRALAHQPPVPFFAARGFEAGPTGPFNVAADGRWEAGETAAVRLAGTNAPQLREGVRVRVAVYAEGGEIASVTARAG